MNTELILTNPTFAYFYGFSLADGHLSENTRNRGLLSIEINIRDRNIFDNFESILPKVSIRERQRITNFGTSNTIIMNCFDLNFRTLIKSFGFPVGKKSLHISIPNIEYSESDFWRGIIDGDGSLGFTNKGFPYVSLVTTSDSLANSYKELIYKITGSQCNSVKNNRDNAFNIMITKENAVALVIFLYYENCIAIDRKKLAANKIKKWVRPDTMKIVLSKKWTPHDINYIKTHSVEDSMNFLNRSFFSILNKLRRTKNQKTYID